MMEPGHVVEETFTVEDEPQEAPPIVSVETGEDGTTRRTETTVTRTHTHTPHTHASTHTATIRTGRPIAAPHHLIPSPASSTSPSQVKKTVKTTTTRHVIPSVSDTLSLDGMGGGGGSGTGRGGYTTPMERVYRQAGPMDYPTSTVPRNYHYGPPVGYEDYRAGPPSETYASLSRGGRMDDRYRYGPG